MVDPTPPSVLSLARVPRSNLAESVAKQLLEQLRQKRPEPGSRIPSERELMAALGVGRSTVREAVNGLAMLGVLEIRHGQGAFVAEPQGTVETPTAMRHALSRGVTRELFEARHVVEPETARLAAVRRTHADLRELERALEDHVAAVERGALAVEPSVRFHVAVGLAAHSDVLTALVTSIAEALSERGPVLEAQPGFCAWEIEQHRSVLEPIAAGDAALAGARMAAHLSAVVPHHERIGLP